MRHRHNSYSSSTASNSPNLELKELDSSRGGCRAEAQQTSGGNDHQPLRNYFVNSDSPISPPKDGRTVEAQLAHYNWPRNQTEKIGSLKKKDFLDDKTSDFNSLESSEPSSSITVIPPQGGNWNTVLSNPNYTRQEFIQEHPSQGFGSVVPSGGTSMVDKDQVNKRSPWIKTFSEAPENGGQENGVPENSKITISSPSMSTSNTSSAEGLGSSSVMSSSSSSNPSSLSQSTGNFAKHNTLIEGRSESSSSSTSSASSISSSSGIADFTPPNTFYRESAKSGRVDINNSNGNERRRSIVSRVDKNIIYQDNKIEGNAVITDNMTNCNDGFKTYYWNGENDNNDHQYSSHGNMKSKRNSAILTSSSSIKEAHRNQMYSSSQLNSSPSQQTNMHNLTINANFMRPIHI